MAEHTTKNPPRPRVSKPLITLAALSLSLCAASWLLLFGFGSGKPAAAASPWLAVGTHGTELGQFQAPRGITALADGSFVVVDRLARVQHFSADGQPLKLWEMKDHKSGNPKGLCALPDGNLLVCDTHYGRLLKMTVDGTILKQWGEPGKEPGQFTRPYSAAVDPVRKAVYIVECGAENDRVQKFSLDGSFIKAWGSFGDGPGQFQRPIGVAVDSDGNVYVADSCNHRIQKFDPDGKLLLAFGKMGTVPGELRYPYDIACSPGGQVYVAEFNNHRVSVFLRDGTFVRCLGAAGDRDGEFACPWSLTLDGRGRLLVSDTGNHRVQILSLKEPQVNARK
ncbi:MAG TPA: hypothetical protein VGP72_04575 [Planctomycetota bacterium]|jgi:DNA-binding beta-propeller fold protein YncE